MRNAIDNYEAMSPEFLGGPSEPSLIGNADAMNGKATIAHLRRKIDQLEMDVDSLKAERLCLKQQISDLLQKDLAV